MCYAEKLRGYVDFGVVIPGAIVEPQTHTVYAAIVPGVIGINEVIALRHPITIYHLLETEIGGWHVLVVVA
ncbi:MAG: hypothetical protein HWN68_18230 [Desulfobacterales bacterium]|nr:hypothetical protein [Desulfobacterales bacterium]